MAGNTTGGILDYVMSVFRLMYFGSLRRRSYFSRSVAFPTRAYHRRVLSYINFVLLDMYVCLVLVCFYCFVRFGPILF